MASRFSGTLQITDLNDFITPSQECIKPIEFQSNKSKTGSKIKIQSDNADLAINEIEQPEKLQKVEITLADCLACSGCITSAESVLITQQSQEELLKVFEENKIQEKAGSPNVKYIVISLSVQPILSLAQRYKLTPEQAFHKLAGFFYQLGANLVLDMTVADDLALLEGAKEFMKRYKANKNGVENQLPMLSSSCPGWVCYAEKTHGNFILPYISITKSPQQIMGSLVKHNLIKLLDISSEQIYHVTVMPCYDKKLEASREDFFNQQTKTKDVDCVITPVELEQMLSEKGLILNEIDENPILQSSSYYTEDIEKRLRGHIGSGSGGYADFIFRYAAKNLFDEENITVNFKNLRNPDFQEAELKKDNQVLLKFAVINGFRNIQNIVQKLKRGKCTYDYVEIMACPSGCLNGGAQIRPEGNAQFRELLSTLENSYHKLPLSKPEENKIVQHLYKIWQKHEPEEIKSYLITQYHEIHKMNTALAIKW